MHNADGADPRIASVMRRSWPFCGVMFAVPMLVAYIPDLSLWLPRLVLR
jgi:TRAP-type C4-dicarboxylate transport system permease large subunit